MVYFGWILFGFAIAAIIVFFVKHNEIFPEEGDVRIVQRGEYYYFEQYVPTPSVLPFRLCSWQEAVGSILMRPHKVSDVQADCPPLRMLISFANTRAKEYKAAVEAANSLKKQRTIYSTEK
jgi:hypothetical protein